MASTKIVSAIWNAQILVSGTVNVTGSVMTLDDGYGASLHVKFTNGATGPTVPAQVQIQVSADNVEWYDFGPVLKGDTANNAIRSWGGIEIPLGVEYLRLIAGSNTNQNVTVDSDISEVTALS